MTPTQYNALADRVERAEGADNALDVLVQIALFVPGNGWKSVRANAAGTKLIYSRLDGKQHTYWADDWTMPERRSGTAAALRAQAALSSEMTK